MVEITSEKLIEIFSKEKEVLEKEYLGAVGIHTLQAMLLVTIRSYERIINGLKSV